VSTEAPTRDERLASKLVDIPDRTTVSRPHCGKALPHRPGEGQVTWSIDLYRAGCQSDSSISLTIFSPALTLGGARRDSRTGSAVCCRPPGQSALFDAYSGRLEVRRRNIARVRPLGRRICPLL